ncbi:MAG: glycosyl transferase [Cyanobacteria bacterium DS2.3.42]|nr:glycosyl transferase [Cyanobacteria bacterium DS2.3.42]
MKVSIVIPCYNHWQYLPEALQSALSQTHFDTEIIVVDDGSTERPSASLLQMLEQKGISLIEIPNSGPSFARNCGIEKAQGELILPLDADDALAPTYIEEAIQVFCNNDDAGIVYCDAEFFGDETGRWELPPYNFPDILLDNYIFASAVFRKDDWHRVGGYNVNMKHGWEDHDFWLSIIELKRTIIRIPKTLFRYRKLAESRTKKFSRNQKIEMYDSLVSNHRQLYSQNIEFVMHRLAELKVLIEDETSETELKRELLNLRDRIRQMESSGFWKLRNKWQTVKRALKVSAQHAPRES